MNNVSPPALNDSESISLVDHEIEVTSKVSESVQDLGHVDHVIGITSSPTTSTSASQGFVDHITLIPSEQDKNQDAAYPFIEKNHKLVYDVNTVHVMAMLYSVRTTPMCQQQQVNHKVETRIISSNWIMAQF